MESTVGPKDLDGALRFLGHTRERLDYLLESDAEELCERCFVASLSLSLDDPKFHAIHIIQLHAENYIRSGPKDCEARQRLERREAEDAASV